MPKVIAKIRHEKDSQLCPACARRPQLATNMQLSTAENNGESERSSSQ